MTNNGEGSVSDVIAGRAQWCVVLGNSWRVRRSLPSGCVDVDLSDPPSSSGGMTRRDRTKSTDSKYTQTQSQGLRLSVADVYALRGVGARGVCGA